MWIPYELGVLIFLAGDTLLMDAAMTLLSSLDRTKRLFGKVKVKLFPVRRTPPTPGKLKPDKYDPYSHQITLLSVLLLAPILFFLCISYSPSTSSSSSLPRRSLWGGPGWESQVRSLAKVKTGGGFTVLVTGTAGLVGSHVSLALKRRGDVVIGLDNFNDYYDTKLRRNRISLLEKSGILVIEGDINDWKLLEKLFDDVPFTHVMNLDAHIGIRYAMKNPNSYIHSNIAGFVNLLEVCKSANPQPAIVWATSSSVYGLNSKVPFSEKDRTDRPASLYAATKKAGKEIDHTYNHISGLSVTGLRFFTVYGPWGRPDMAYFFFTEHILSGKRIDIFEGPNHSSVARDFTYIDGIVKGCLGALDTAKKSTGSRGKKRGPAQLRVFNLGNTSPVTVTRLVSTLEKLLKVKENKKLKPIPRNGMGCSLMQRELGYEPTTDLESGLKKFVQWYLKYYSGSKKRSSR